VLCDWDLDVEVGYKALNLWKEPAVILFCTYEELSAVNAGGERVLAEASDSNVVVVAPPQVIADIETLVPRLVGDVSVATLADQRSIARAVAFIAMDCRQRMDSAIVMHHAASELAVAAYFEYAHVLTLQDRLRRIGEQMTDLIELMTGAPPTEETAKTVAFPD
jgi:hypothetical protein